MAVTQEQIDAISNDFNILLDDIMAAVPHSQQLDIAVMVFKMAEATVLQLLRQNLIRIP